LPISFVFICFFSPSAFQAPLAVFDPDIDDCESVFQKTSKRSRMSRLFHSKVSNQTAENNDPKVSQRELIHKKSSSIVVNNPLSNLPAKEPNARIVRIRLVFIHIGERCFFYIHMNHFSLHIVDRRDRYAQRKVSSGYLLRGQVDTKARQSKRTGFEYAGSTETTSE
jgi:hypothetical protein